MKKKKRKAKPKAKAELTGFDLVKRMRQLSAKAADKLEELLESEKTTQTNLVKVIEMIQDRAHGKAPIQLNITKNLSQEDIQELAAKILEKRGDLPGVPKIVEAKLLPKKEGKDG